MFGTSIVTFGVSILTFGGLIVTFWGLIVIGTGRSIILPTIEQGQYSAILT